MDFQGGNTASPLEEWQSTFKEDVLTLHQIMLLRTRNEDEESRQKMYPWIKAISDSVNELDDAVRNLKRYVADERNTLEQLRELRTAISTQTERYSLMKGQIPAEVSEILGLNANPKNVADDRKKENNAIEGNGKHKGDPNGVEREPQPIPHSSKRKVPPKQSRLGSAKNGKPKIPKPNTTARKESKSSSDIPVISSVSQEELDAAPQYVKGRLTVEKIERVVESLNKIASAKYEILGKPYRDLNTIDKNTYQDFQESECDETGGKQFLTDAEIKGFGKLRLDATAKSVINVLRHVGALKHVRGKNNVTILIIN